MRDLLGVAAPSRDEECLRNPAFAAATVHPQIQPPDSGELGLNADRERYSLPSGLPKKPQPGQTASVGGRVYRFNENHRWESITHDAKTTEQRIDRSARAVLPSVRLSETTAERFVAERDRLPPEKLAFLTRYTVGEIRQLVARGGRLLQSDDGAIGYMLVPLADRPGEYELSNLFKAEGLKGSGATAAIHAIAQGASQLDCIGTYLAEFYTRLGFKTYRVEQWSDEFASPGWNYEKYGRPPIFFMRYVGETRNPREIEERFASGYYRKFEPDAHPPGYKEDR